jgi:hypothetical protein
LTKCFFSIALSVSLLLVAVTGPCLADGSERRDFAVGWQISRPASGLSVKIPVKDQYYLQPIFAFSLTEDDQATAGHLSLGLRASLELPTRNDFHPYTGVAWGYSKDFKETPVKNRTLENGLQGFFGVEYQKYLVRLALEIGMGTFQNADGTNFAGMTCNFSLFYYF